MEEQTSNGSTTTSEDPDEVILNPDYVKKLKEASANQSLDGKPLTMEELEAVFGPQPLLKFGKRTKDGFTIEPYFKLQDMKVGGKVRKVPFIGVKGTF